MYMVFILLLTPSHSTTLQSRLGKYGPIAFIAIIRGLERVTSALALYVCLPKQRNI